MRLTRWTLCAVGLCSLAAAIAGCPSGEPDEQVAGFNPGETSKVSFSLHSRAFTNGASLPARFVAPASGVSPSLYWNGIPNGTQEFALIVTDLNQPTSPFAQWTIYKIPPDILRLPEGLPPSAVLSYPPGALQGLNYDGGYGYLGPETATEGSRRLEFRLFALNSPLDVPAGLRPRELLDAMEARVIAEATLIGVTRKQGFNLPGQILLGG